VIATDQRHRSRSNRASVLRAVPAMIRIKSSRPDRRWLTLVTYHRSCSHAHGSRGGSAAIPASAVETGRSPVMVMVFLQSSFALPDLYPK